jgi:zinc transporter ZupT
MLLSLTQGGVPIRHVVLFLAISLHAFMAGISVGVTDDRESMKTLFWAIMVHKPVEALALGGNFVRDGATVTQAAISMIGFSFVTPIGVAVGMGVASQHHLAMVLNGMHLPELLRTRSTTFLSQLAHALVHQFGLKNLMCRHSQPILGSSFFLSLSL